MQLHSLHKAFDSLQIKFGDKELNTIYGAGETNSPDVCFIFMNPTARNISAAPTWKGLRAPWLGTKNTWKLLTSIGLFSKKLNEEIQNKKPEEWDDVFCEKVYNEVKKNKYFITNLAKCTKQDASHVNDSVFKEYRKLMLKEISILKPKLIISFGNQVSSILLEKSITVSNYRKKPLKLNIEGKNYSIYPVFYPVGQGMRNINKSIEDIQFILSKS